MLSKKLRKHAVKRNQNSIEGIKISSVFEGCEIMNDYFIKNDVEGI